MKKLFLFALVATLFSSCKLYNQFPQYAKDHNIQQSVVFDKENGHNKFEASIDSVYDYSKVAEVCDTLDITFRISRASIAIKGDCSNVGEDVYAILKKAIGQIKFW